MFRLAIVLGMFASVYLTGIAAEPKPANDLEALQGNWKPLQCDYEGTPQMPAEQMKQVTGVFEKSEYYLYFSEKANVRLLAHALITLDSTANPKTITFEFADGPLKGVKRQGIYEIAGDQLKLCYGPLEKPRPIQFRTMPGSGYFLETWARQSK